MSKAKSSLSQTPTVRPIRCCCVGDGTVGKTCLLLSYAKNDFPTDYVPTVFSNYAANIIVDGELVNLSLWDTAGQETYDKVRPLSYPGTHFFVVCYSVVDMSSFQNIKYRWIPEVRKHCPNAIIVLVGTKSDLRMIPNDTSDKATKQCVTYEMGKQLQSEINANVFLECSAKEKKNVNRVFDEGVRASISAMTMKDRNRNKLNCQIL